MAGLEKRGWENFLVCKKDSPFQHACGLSADRVFPVKMRGEMDVFSGMKIARIAKATGAAIIHCHTAGAHSLAIISRIRRRAKLVVTRRVDFPLKGGKVSVWKYRKADHLIAISSKIFNVLISSGIHEQNISLAPSGVELSENYDDSTTANLYSELNIDKGDKIIGMIAAMVGHKDWYTMLKAFSIVREALPNVWLLALGDGDDMTAIEAFAKKTGVVDGIKFLGFREDVGDFFGMFDVYVQSSKMEGLCSTIIEAMHHRLLIAATSAGGIPDLIEDKVTGLLSVPENPQMLAGNILKLLENPNKYRHLGEAAHEKSKLFSAENMVSKTEEVYLKLLKANNA